MKISNPSLLAEYRTPGNCEICGRACQVREPAHRIAVAQGRLDVAINLLALGSTRRFLCGCHSAVHSGDVKYFRRIGKVCHDVADIDRLMLLTIAVREVKVADDIRDAIYLLRRLPKDPSAAVVDRELVGMSPGAVELVRGVLLGV